MTGGGGEAGGGAETRAETGSGPETGSGAGTGTGSALGPETGPEGAATSHAVRNQVTGGTHGTVVQAGRIEHLVVHQHQTPPPPPPDEVTVAPPWGRRGTPLRGRDALLAALRAGAGTQVLYGLGGVGKTTLALDVARAFADAGAPVWWVAAQDAGRLVGGLRAVARRVGLGDAELAAGQTADLLWERLAALPGRWLLVVDNADDLALLDGPGSLAAGTGWVRAPAASRGLVLVTTRDGDPAAWGAGPALHPLGALPAPDAALVLADRASAGAGPAPDAERLAARLGGLPLALDSAGRYLASVAERPAFLRTPGEPATYGAYLDALGTGDLAVDGDGTLARIWAMSLRLLRDRGHGHAEELLRLLAGFADAPVPLRVLAPGRAAVPPGELWSCLQALDRLGLAALRTDGEPVVALHPLVRDAYRGERERLSAPLARESEEPEGRGPLWPPLVPHLLDGLGPGTPAEVWEAAVLAVRSLVARGLVGDAAEAARAVAEGAVRELTDRHPAARAALLQHGNTLLSLSESGSALAVLGPLAESCVRELGPEDPFTLQVRHAWAMAHSLSGDFAASRTEYADVLRARLRVLGPDAEATLNTRHNLAVDLAALGRTAEALAEMEAILEAETRVHGAEHFYTLVTRESRACLLRDSGDLDAARPELAVIAEARHRLFGAEHPVTLTARFNLARCLAPEAARAELAAVLEARTRVLGAGHPVTVATREALARAARTLPG
ncbi:tetratricopeptide repeat protein [Streptomyces sp. NPDC048659]|uniref:tetratricopeptide repeat protein n=1 Tax=Streptomyces sp. NPDC048659 TaxID=3155489 RepID=UPI0034345D46